MRCGVREVRLVAGRGLGRPGGAAAEAAARAGCPVGVRTGCPVGVRAVSPFREVP